MVSESLLNIYCGLCVNHLFIMCESVLFEGRGMICALHSVCRHASVHLSELYHFLCAEMCTGSVRAEEVNITCIVYYRLHVEGEASCHRGLC